VGGFTTLSIPTGNVFMANAIVTQNVWTTNVYATGNVVVSGQATTGLTTLSVTGNMVVSNALTMSNLYTTNVYALGNVVVTGESTTGMTTLYVTGNLYAANAMSMSNLFTTNVYTRGNVLIDGTTTVGMTTLSVTGNAFASNAIVSSNVHLTNVFATGLMTAGELTVVGNLNVSNTFWTQNVFANSYVLTGYYPVATPGYNGATTMNAFTNVYVSNAVTVMNAWAYNNVFVTSNVGLLTTNIWGDVTTGGLNVDEYNSGATITTRNRLTTYQESPIGTTPVSWFGDESYDTRYIRRNIAGTTYAQALVTPTAPQIIQLQTKVVKTGFQTKLIQVSTNPGFNNGNFEDYNPYITASTGFVYSPTSTSWTFTGSGVVACWSQIGNGFQCPISPSTSNVSIGIQNASSFSQTLTNLTPGARYSISFYMNARPGLDGNSLNVNIGGTPQVSGVTTGGTSVYSTSSVASTTNWQYVTTSAWTAIDTTALVIFSSTNIPGDKTVFLDNIVLNSIDNFQPVTWSISGQPDGVHLTNITSTRCVVVVPKGTPAFSGSVTVTATNVVGSASMSFTLTTGTYVGTISAFPATNAVSILQEWPKAPDGIYWINVNGTATQTYCLMDQKWDGGGWMMLMKMVRGTTFLYGATYWTDQNSTLNPTDLNRNKADAKFGAYNYVPIKDIMGIWPDVGYTGGSIRNDLATLVSCAANTYPRENFYYGNPPYLYADNAAGAGGTINHAVNLHIPPVINNSRASIDGIPFVAASGQYYDLGTARFDLGTRGFTAVVDAQISGYNLWQRFFDFGNLAQGGYYIFLAASANSGVLRFAMGTPASGEIGCQLDTGTVGSTTQSTTFYMNLNQRYRIACVYDPVPGTTGLMMLYVDGTLVQTLIPSVHMLDTTFNRVWIGRSQYNTDGYLGGTVWSIATYNGVLTAEQIQNYKFTHEKIQGVPRGVGAEAWTWLVNNWWQNGARTTAYNGFLAANSRDVPGQAVDFFFFDGFSRNIFGSQHPTRRFVIGGTTHLTAAGLVCNTNTRWGYLMNENLYNDYSSGDGLGGIGHSYAVGQYSAGDVYSCCSTSLTTEIAASIGFNRAMRFELYGR
jgi:hypothetical protein